MHFMAYSLSRPSVASVYISLNFLSNINIIHLKCAVDPKVTHFTNFWFIELTPIKETEGLKLAELKKLSY